MLGFDLLGFFLVCLPHFFLQSESSNAIESARACACMRMCACNLVTKGNMFSHRADFAAGQRASLDCAALQKTAQICCDVKRDAFFAHLRTAAQNTLKPLMVRTGRKDETED